jgi:mono/diheme cytochrome c family protein
VRKRILLRVVAVVFALLLLAQAVPYGRSHTNPPGRTEPQWSGAHTRELARRACFDCHSNETKWPWYSHVAPASWLVQSDVDEGRGDLNFSEGPAGTKRAKKAAREVSEGDMPPLPYRLMHPEARLTDAEKAELIHGLEATFGKAKGGDDEKRRDGS